MNVRFTMRLLAPIRASQKKLRGKCGGGATTAASTYYVLCSETSFHGTEHDGVTFLVDQDLRMGIAIPAGEIRDPIIPVGGHQSLPVDRSTKQKC